MKFTYLFLALIVFFNYGCDKTLSEPLGAGPRYYGFVFADNVKQRELEIILVRENVRFVKDKHGIAYLLNDHAKYLGAVREVRYGGVIDPLVLETFNTLDEELINEIVVRLKDSGIPFNRMDSPGMFSVVWIQRYGVAVDSIMQDVHIYMADRRIEKSVEEGVIPRFLVD